MPIVQNQFTIMGNEIFIQDTRVCVQPLRSRLEAIQKLQPLTMVKGCRSFARMINFLSMFCPELQKLLKPIYDLTRKGRPFVWGKEQQDSFKEIKCRLIKPPVLHMPNKTGRFHLYSAPVNLQLVVHYIRYKIDCICKQKASRSCKKLFHNRTRARWFSHKYCMLFTFAQKS